MTHIGNYAGDVERWGVPPAEQQQIVPDAAAITKALVVLRALSDAGLREPYGFNREDAATVWASALHAHDVDALLGAVAEWISQPGVEWPSVGDVLAVVRGQQLEAEQAERARNPRVCTTCWDVHYVKVVDAVAPVPKRLKPAELIALQQSGDPWPEVTVEQHHMAPCPDCPSMRTRRGLYDTPHLGPEGHFSAAHQEKGGCPECWPYTDRPRHRARERAASRR